MSPEVVTVAATVAFVLGSIVAWEAGARLVRARVERRRAARLRALLAGRPPTRLEAEAAQLGQHDQGERAS